MKEKAISPDWVEPAPVLDTVKTKLCERPEGAGLDSVCARLRFE